jgi:glycosyltransferase involved in cell wall biosynthesis
VSYDVSGCREVVQDTVNGFLIPFKDRDALFLAVLKLLEDSKLRYEMGKKGRNMILKDFTQEKIAAETISVWNEFLK